MKPVRRTDSASQSCSCTSCLYKSESEQPSIRKYIAHGSRIDRLYYGKYIPLREQKLLNRLVRTRAVYDDLRARLISDSTLSLDKNADLRPRKHHHAIKPLNSTEKSGAILELVDIIDKGGVKDPKKLSECCSCCSCSSKAKILESAKKEHGKKRTYSRRFEGEYAHRAQYGQRAQHGQRAQYGHRVQYGQGMQGRLGERYNKRGVRFKAKHIRSDPCTCTFKFSGLIKKHSKAMMQKARLVPLVPFPTMEQQHLEESKLKKIARKSYDKYKGLQDKLEQDMKKLNESAANMKQNLQLHTKKSLEQLKQAKDKFKANIETGVRKSVQAVKALQRKDKAFENLEFVEDETNFKIKKDSIVKFKDYLKRKELMKDWECDLECVPDTCEPEECFRIIKLGRLHKRNRQRNRKQAVKYEKFNREVNIGEAPLKKSSSSVQAEQFAMTTATHMKKQKPILRVGGGNQAMKFEMKEVKKESKQGTKQVTKDKANLQQAIVKKSEETAPISFTREEHAIHNVKNVSDSRRKHGLKGKETHYLKKDISDTRSRQAVRIGSSFSFDVEFYKNKPDSKTSSRLSQPSGIHLTDNKVKQYAHKGKQRKVRGHHKGSQVILKPSLEPPRGLKELNIIPRQLNTPLIQTSEIPIVKRVSNIKIKTGHGTKSVASLTKKQKPTSDKNIAMEVKRKELFSQVGQQNSGLNESPRSRTQAVRIASTFSFNVEFYKKDNQHEVEPPSPLILNDKVKRTRDIRTYAPPKMLKNKGSFAKAGYMQAKTTLIKCICTLKSHKFKKAKKRIKSSTTSTATSKVIKIKIPPAMLNKNIETKKGKLLGMSKEYQLLPYECEPGVCIPGECDPILCKQLLDLRNSKLKTYDRGSYTSSRQTKSTSSLVLRPFALKTKNVQSSVVPTKPGGTSVPRRFKKKYTSEESKGNDINNTSGRQAVRIGSSFSFNIEFYKDKQVPTIENDEDVSNIPAQIKYNKTKLKEGGYQKYTKKNKAMFAQVLNIDENIGPSLKRCFCTLKLFKNKNIKKKELRKGRMLTTDTQTFADVVPIMETVDRGTKTKWRHNYELLPFECEPYFCVPGECDPYVCLERIKKRELNVRDYGVYTGKPKVTSISSFTESPYTRSAAILAHPKLFGKGTNVKGNYNRALGTPRDIAFSGGSGETYDSVNSKQAVRIGSSFNFSIEFSKQLPQTLTLTKQRKGEISRVNKKVTKNKGIKVAKLRVDHVDVDTQSIEPKKFHRASLVRPMLKRCFCTLNLQKKTKGQFRKGYNRWAPRNQYFAPKMYTISRAMTTKTGIISHHDFGSQEARIQVTGSNKMISISTSSFLFKKFATTSVSKYNTLKLCPILEAPTRLKQPIKINSNISVEVEFIRRFKLSKESALDNISNKRLIKSFSFGYINKKPTELIKLLSEPSFLNENKITGINQYLERCFYTMNVQILQAKGMKNLNYKLKPYECEPGICVPGECDPYECQKLIMRRHMKNVHRGSSTQSANKSISSFTTQTGTGSRSTQFRRHVRTHSQELKPQKYKHRNQREIKHKQAVRVGSSFSFDVEFSKKSSQSYDDGYRGNESDRYYKKPIKSTYSTKSKGAQGRRVRYGKDRQLQSTASSNYRGTNAPRMKKCFCTLKLQKKGRIHRENAKLNVLPAKPPPSITSRSMKVGTANTKYHNIPKQRIYNLQPYECEPGICIPGQCDPYECLKKMSNRKDFGVATTSHGEKSISSMTSGGRYAKRKLQTRGTDVKHKKTHKKGVKRSNDIQSISSNVSERRSRQAVRIGSNFSFNVEFYKDKPGTQEIKERHYKEKRTKAYGSDAKESKPRKRSKGSVSQSSRVVSHRDTQIESPTNQISTMTSSFIKRCFCTAKLQGIKIPENQNTSTFMQKCFCLLGLRNKQKKDNQPPQIQSKNADKQTNTNYRHKVLLPPLEPYECEPGICIPGQCDPYVCDKIIQQRLAKKYTKSSETESLRTQSVSSSFGYAKRHRHGATQARAIKHHKQKQHILEGISIASKNTNNGNKRVVRIGSNFSFNVEFYKENRDGSQIREKTKVDTYPSSRRNQYKTKTKLKHIKATGTNGAGVRTNESQIDKKEMRAFGVNPLLKRCFCTMKLLKKPIGQEQNTNKTDINKATMRTVETQSNKILEDQQIRNDVRGEALLPYECEPFVCIPGECNPLECLERIKKRNQKNSGTLTEYPNRKSIGSVATKTTRDKYLQAKNRGGRPSKDTQRTSNIERARQYKSGDSPRQAVRIGSNFSFNIEFFKSNEDNAPEIFTRPSREHFHMKQSSKGHKKHTKSQPSYFGRSVDSQVSPNIRSADTGMSHLKRCFCTLQLKNRNESNVIKPKSEHSAVGDFIKKCMCAFKINKVGKLHQIPPKPAVKYEIKGTSTYSQSPRQDQFIKPITMLDPYECEPNVCIPGECDPYECLKRIQRRQVRDFGTEYKRNVRHIATDSIGPLTRDTEVQLRQRQRLNSQGTSFPSKRRKHSHDTSQYSSKYYKGGNKNRQAVRIGSNFSFNIEFFKEKGDQPHSESQYKESKAERVPKVKNRAGKLMERSRGSESVGKNIRCQSSQCPFLKKQFNSSASNTTPKRCFCTLKLLKNQNNLNSEVKPMPLISPPKTMEDKMTATKKKYTIPHELGLYECPPLMCIPGECDPYDCLEKMKKRGRKFRHVGTRTGKTSIVSVGNRTSKIRAQGNQFIGKSKNFTAYTPQSEPQFVILRSPPMAQNENRQNNRAVRIGSNFNFSIDFFKEKSHPAVIRSPKIVRTRDKDEDLKSYLNKNVTANTGKFRHHDSQVDGTVTRDQASDAGNILKRCFCTLQLQKSSRQRKMLRNKMHSPGINVTYPQTVTVGRVTVEPFNRKKLKTQKGTQNQSSQVRQSKSTDPKLMNNLRTVSTKIDKKHIRNNDIFQSKCDRNSCPNYQKKHPKTGTKNDMQTILPYTPSKFNKKESKTLVSDKNKQQRRHGQDEAKLADDKERRDTLLFDRRKRLTAKKSKKSIPENKIQDTNCNLTNSIFGRCAKFFKGTKNISKSRISQENRSNFRNEQFKIVVKPKNTKNVNINQTVVDEACPIVCPKNTDNFVQKYSKLRGIDTENKNKLENNKNESRNDKQIVERKKMSSKNPNMKVTFADSIKYLPSMTKDKKIKSLHHRPSRRSKLCYSCSVNNCPLQPHNAKSDKERQSVFHMITNRLSKSTDKPVVYSESADNCQYCQCCKKKLEAGEISKGAGDRRVTEKIEKVPLSQKKKPSAIADKRLSVSSQHKGRAATCPCGYHKPLFEIQVDSQNYGIVNKNEVLQNVKRETLGNVRKSKFQDKEEHSSQKKTAHDDSCTCCKCIKKRLTEGAKISVPGKGTPKIIGTPGKTLVKKSPTASGPCICGSIPCAIESQRKKKLKKREKIKPCICGTKICSRESRKMKKLREQYVCTCSEEMDRRRAEMSIYKKKDLQRRLQIEREKDERRRLKRIKRNAELEKRVKKYKDASDTLLAVDSLVDVGKLGFSTLGGVLRTTAKAVYDPKVAFERMKCKKTDPETALRRFEQQYMESDAAATARRLKLRCMFMRNVQKAREKLEENPVTHFILHIADKNAKTRKFKRKPVKRFREPLDFECSLYMASLRKRPCLSVYYKWPWFYPHFVTMLNIWKQFTDIMLFLLAAVVWSPCILCMEGCRAMMCCVFCTG